ncbi:MULTISPECIES: hypothetical protein [Variovorax]|uniref:hypothetical protein n=1 Tax=Variovorax TaxID=34072 RepID=UPI002855F964|nr:hypothetical protein [Variovorax sp. 3319]MDR6887700.1 hypothetical protein [Variovorax sp. 3319]
MSDPTGKLDPETHRRVFAERVVPRSALSETTPQARPHAIVLAGQPGAGNSRSKTPALTIHSRRPQQ